MAGFLAERASWDDAFILASRLSSERIYLELLERGLRPMLNEARIATVGSWVELGRSLRLDAPIIDLAEAEIAFSSGDRPQSGGSRVAGEQAFGTEPCTSHASALLGGPVSASDL